MAICEQKWNGNLSAFDLTVITEAVYAVGQEDVASLTQQQFLCLYFDVMDIYDLKSGQSNLSTADCWWQIVFNATDYPLFMHFGNDHYATDVIAIRGTYSPEEMLQDFVLFNHVNTPSPHSLTHCSF